MLAKPRTPARTGRSSFTQRLSVALAFAGLLAGSHAQEIKLDGLRPSSPAGQHVALETEAATVRAGHPDLIELRFHVDPGFHINSHTPADELLIPTTLKLDAAELHSRIAEYPAGEPFTLNISGQKQQLSVYQNQFRIAVELPAMHAGSLMLTGILRYQACDGAQCFPACTLPVKVLLTAK